MGLAIFGQIYDLLTSDEQYMYRCLQLARLGAGQVAPNPMVGAVLVHKDRIIGEGYHARYGQAHAEVNCINEAISLGHEDLIRGSTLYVSLEPCAHHGKTPPCADLIIQHKIPSVMIGCRDPFSEVNGKGIEKLSRAGILTEVGMLENQCKDINRRFFCFHTQQRPYVVLKWAQTADGFMALLSESGGVHRLSISNEFTNRLVHKWRSEEPSILVGTNTVMNDNPELTTRLWPGSSPVRLVIDMDLRLPAGLRVFDGKEKTIVFNKHRHGDEGSISYYRVGKDASLIRQICNALFQLQIQSVMVEGGARLLQSFIDEGIWDEARVITNGALTVERGLQAPRLPNARPITEWDFLSDKVIQYYK